MNLYLRILLGGKVALADLITIFDIRVGIVISLSTIDPGQNDFVSIAKPENS